MRVRFPGLSGEALEADYSEFELLVMRRFAGSVEKVREAQLIHEFKACLDAVIVEDGADNEGRARD